MRLIAYIRVSRVAGREGENFISPTVQREKIEQTAKAQGHTIVEWLEDLDQPGSKASRPGFQAALEAVENGEADGIIVAKLDRFARSIADAATAIQRLTASGGQLVSVEDGFDSSTPMGRFAVTMVLALAELELERIRDNWAAAGSHAASRGLHVCKVAPVGYRKAEDGRLEPDPIAAPIIREVFRRRGAGTSWTDLCAMLDERLPRENGNHWSRSTVSSLITRRTYLGEARGGGIVNTDAHPPLITRGEYEAAQVAEADGRHERGSDGGALLAGLLSCGSCGHSLTRVSNGRRGYHNYKCRKRHGDGICEAPAGISVTRVDEYVEREFLAMVEREPLAAQGKPADGTLEQAVAALEAAERELSEYRDANLISVVGRDTYIEGLTQRQQAVDAGRRALGDASTSSPLEGIRDLRELWPTLGVRERRHLLGSVLDRAIVTAAPGAGRGASVEDRLSLIWR
jgi:DNA invertase Pin-like site-specific DNA recombinase